MTARRPTPEGEADSLRARAEARLRTRQEGPRPRTEADALRLLQELEIHQVELEIQNAELEKTRDELESALARYTDLYDFAPVGYFTLDALGKILAANLTGAALLGVPRGRLVGRHLRSFVAFESRSGLASCLSRTLEGATQETCELTLAAEGEAKRFVRLEATASSTGEECRAALLEVTRQRAAEDEARRVNEGLEAAVRARTAELQAAEDEVRRVNEGLEAAVRTRTAELQAANSELEAFAHSISHDLRAPLRAISGFAQILSEDCAEQLPPTGEDYIRRIRAGAQRLGVLIDDLLRLSRTGRCGLERTDLDLATPCREILAELASGSPERHVESVVAGPLLVRGDAHLLRQLLENLLGNAWKFTAATAGARIEVGAEGEADGWRELFVRDNGAGFDPEYVGKLFHPFQRLHAESEFPGTGIGLAIVDRIARFHGGAVRAEGAVGRGATFRVRLPAPEKDRS